MNAKEKWTNKLGTSVEDGIIDVQAETTDIQHVTGNTALAVDSPMSWDDFASEDEFSGYVVKGEKRLGSDKVIIKTPDVPELKVTEFKCIIPEPPVGLYTLFDQANNVLYKSYNRNERRGIEGCDTKGEPCNSITARTRGKWQFKGHTQLIIEGYDGNVFEWLMPATGFYNLRNLAKTLKQDKGLTIDRCELRMFMAEHTNEKTGAIYMAPKFEFVEERKA